MMVYLIYFSSSSHHNLIVSTYEFILEVKSSRVVVFFIFNVIVITIFFGSFKPFKDCDRCIAVSNPAHKVDHEQCYLKEVAKEHNDDQEYYDDDDNYSDDDDYEYHGSDGYDEDVDDDDDCSSDDDDDNWLCSEERDSSDLQRRSEEFIAKINKRWREEKISERLLCMVAVSTEILTSSSSG
ncbi:hypothetical protein TorRG33x02_350580 [Trema orientale]|uniref:Transmembrane protein n=1 Tax=Trema orientale TaxID=63057 RepID=A0A2P5AH62_TREOI|nr:hypothetical protein TorRG33x02_350580 [Trema orientale]